MTLRVLLAMTLICGAKVGAQSSGVPDVIAHTNPEVLNPMWVSAIRAVTKEGQLDEKILGSSARRRLEHLQAANEKAKAASGSSADCHVFGGRVVDHYRPNQSLDDLVAHASAVLQARVEDVAQGFLYGTPGSLLLVTDVTWLRRVDEARSANPIFVFYPDAAIRTAHGTICAKPTGSAIPPAIGDRLLLFPMIDAVQSEAGMVILVEPSREIVINSAKGGLQAPRFITDVAGHTWSDVTRTVSGRLGSEDRSH